MRSKENTVFLAFRCNEGMRKEIVAAAKENMRDLSAEIRFRLAWYAKKATKKAGCT